MLKKFFLSVLIATAMFGVATYSANAATPAQDTWVLTWDGANYFVKAGTLDYTQEHPDVAPEFSCVVTHNGKSRLYEFRARGITVLYVDGQLYSDSQKSRFVAAMYNAICDKLIYHRN